MTIKEVEKKLNISRANIRFYEKEGLLEPKRNENEYRNYSKDDIERLKKIILFRKCNISIENIRLIFNNKKSIEEIFKKQITIIENEVKELEGAKKMCKKLALDKSSIDRIDTNKYINIMNNEEQNGNKFYSVTKDYILANEKLYQSIIESKEFKGGDKMKKKIKIIIYIANFILTVFMFALFDLIIHRYINWTDAILFTTILTSIDLIGVKKYIENKSGKKFNKKDNINHFIIIITLMIISLFGYQTIKSIIEINKDPNNNVIEMSLKKSLIDISNKKYKNNVDYIYAESHKILDTEVKNNKIYVYVVANYGLFNKENCQAINETLESLTLIYEFNKNEEGIYNLLEYKENSIPDSLKKKANVNFEDDYFKNQLNNYCYK